MCFFFFIAAPAVNINSIIFDEKQEIQDALVVLYWFTERKNLSLKKGGNAV